ncbi:MAG: hypothetical protein U5O39_14390 [Gammaproteobacteria bacterium]|nr:hypothetical protein [Gammaproteobacteria bacterium]
MQRLITGKKWVEQVGALQDEIRARLLERRRPLTGFVEPFPELSEDVSIGFVGGFTAQFENFLGAVGHGQLRQQFFDVAQIEIGGHPAGESDHFVGDGSCYVGIAIAIASHP